MQHFETSLRKPPLNLHAEGLDWNSFPEVDSLIYPVHFSGRRQDNGKQVLILREKVCLVSEWVITSTNVPVRLKYGQTGCPPLWEDAQDYSAVLKKSRATRRSVHVYLCCANFLNAACW